MKLKGGIPAPREGVRVHYLWGFWFLLRFDFEYPERALGMRGRVVLRVGGGRHLGKKLLLVRTKAQVRNTSRLGARRCLKQQNRRV